MCLFTKLFSKNLASQGVIINLVKIKFSLTTAFDGFSFFPSSAYAP